MKRRRKVKKDEESRKFEQCLHLTKARDKARLSFINYDSEWEEKWISKAYKHLRNTPTMHEKILGNYLFKHHVKFYFQHPFKIDGHIYFADFYLMQYNTIIEVDGSQHIGSESDMERDSNFKSIGIKTIRIPNKYVKDTVYLREHVAYLWGAKPKKLVPDSVVNDLILGNIKFAPDNYPDARRITIDRYPMVDGKKVPMSNARFTASLLSSLENIADGSSVLCLLDIQFCYATALKLFKKEAKEIISSKNLVCEAVFTGETAKMGKTGVTYQTRASCLMDYKPDIIIYIS